MTAEQPQGALVRPGREPPKRRFRDDGCQIWRRCLTCPHVLCIYDDPRGPRAAVQAIRDEELWELYHSGWVTKRLAAYYGISPRQVFRIVDRLRQRHP